MFQQYAKEKVSAALTSQNFAAHIAQVLNGVKDNPQVLHIVVPMIFQMATIVDAIRSLNKYSFGGDNRVHDTCADRMVRIAGAQDNALSVIADELFILVQVISQSLAHGVQISLDSPQAKNQHQDEPRPIRVEVISMPETPVRVVSQPPRTLKTTIERDPKTMEMISTTSVEAFD